ncbi:MAG: PUA domain-containing protein [Sulfolobales archaeon]
MSIRVAYSALRRKNSKELVEKFCELYPRACLSLGASSTSLVYAAVFDGEVIYVIDGVPAAFKSGEILAPTLVSARMTGIEAFHYAVVDEGAVKPILNGADVMAPGILRVSDFSADVIVVVWSRDEKTPLAVTQALMGSSEVVSKRRGKALKNLHYAGDGIWRVSLEVLKKFGKV